jgi:NAD+ kinase
MNPIFRQVALIGKYHAAVAPSLAASMRAGLEDIARFLASQGCEVVVERETAIVAGMGDLPTADVETIGRECDLGLVVGGDGTMLGSARQLAQFGLPLVGINQGRLGFITDVPIGHYADALSPMIAGDYEEERRTMLEGGVWRDEREIFEGFAVNDVVVSRGPTSSMIELKVTIGDEFVGNFRADGLIVASPTGSTAYALSAGGPILHPGIAAWVMAPIAPHDLSNRPIVLPDTGEITIQLVQGRDASVNFDMQGLASLLPGDRIVVRRSSHQVRFLHPLGWSYYATLRRKLHWNTGV